MASIEVFHQFEIRYSPIFNFPLVSREIIGPYISRTSSINMQEENSIKERITLNFDNDTNSIVFLWDRMLFNTSYGIFGLKNNNSVIEEPFFSLFSKISALKSFEQVKNCLFYSVAVNVSKNYDNNKFATEFLQPTIKSILPFDDNAVTLAKEENDNITNLNFGPYMGIEDLRKRGLKYPLNQQEALNASGGILVDLKIVKVLNSINFKSYQKIFSESNSIKERIWARI